MGTKDIKVSQGFSKKSPSQSPVDFFNCKQAGGWRGGGSYTAPDKLSSGAMQEKIYGRSNLSDKLSRKSEAKPRGHR